MQFKDIITMEPGKRGGKPSVPSLSYRTSTLKGTRPPNPKEKIKMTSHIFRIGFGGESITSRDGESLEGVRQ